MKPTLYIVVDEIRMQAAFRCRDKAYRGLGALLPSWTRERLIYDAAQVLARRNLRPARIVVLEVIPGSLMDGIRGTAA